MQSNGQEVVPGRSHEFASLPSPERNDPVFSERSDEGSAYTPIAGKSFAALRMTPFSCYFSSADSGLACLRPLSSRNAGLTPDFGIIG